MKVLSLTQPWASLLAGGAKQIETRSWGTSYRGPVAVHAAKGFPRKCADLVGGEPFASALYDLGYEAKTVRARAASLPRGAIVGVVDLVECAGADWFLLGQADACVDLRHRYLDKRSAELAFGDFGEAARRPEVVALAEGRLHEGQFKAVLAFAESTARGDDQPPTRTVRLKLPQERGARWCWFTRGARRLAQSVPFRGSLGLRDLDADVERLVLAGLA